MTAHEMLLSETAFKICAQDFNRFDASRSGQLEQKGVCELLATQMERRPSHGELKAICIEMQATAKQQGADFKVTLADYLSFVYGCEAQYVKQLGRALQTKAKLQTEEAELKVKIAAAKQKLHEMGELELPFAHADTADKQDHVKATSQKEVLDTIENETMMLEMDVQDLKNEHAQLVEQLPSVEHIREIPVTLNIGLVPYMFPCCQTAECEWEIQIEDDTIVKHLRAGSSEPASDDITYLPGFQKIDSVRFEFYGIKPGETRATLFRANEYANNRLPYQIFCFKVPDASTVDLAAVEETALQSLTAVQAEAEAVGIHVDLTVTSPSPTCGGSPGMKTFKLRKSAEAIRSKIHHAAAIREELAELNSRVNELNVEADKLQAERTQLVAQVREARECAGGDTNMPDLEFEKIAPLDLEASDERCPSQEMIERAQKRVEEIRFSIDMLTIDNADLSQALADIKGMDDHT